MSSPGNDVPTKGPEAVEKKVTSKESWRAPQVRKLRINPGTTGPGDIHPVELSTFTGPS
jgi:hypothetical protein